MRSRALLLCAILAVAGAFSPSPRAVAGPDDAASPVPAAVGTTPAAGCPQFFLAFTLARVDACARSLAASGWGLTAFAAGPGGFAGVFSAAAPDRTLQSDDEPDLANGTTPGDAVGLTFADGHAVFVRERGHVNRPCRVELVYAATMIPRTYARLVLEQAARGCVPAAAVTYDPGIEDETEETVELFVRGNPRAIGSQIHGSDADFAAFERRARARGFQRLKLGREPDLFGLARGTTSVERIPLGRGAARYDALGTRLALANRRGERAIDLDVDLYADGVDVLFMTTSGA